MNDYTYKSEMQIRGGNFFVGQITQDFAAAWDGDSNVYLRRDDEGIKDSTMDGGKKMKQRDRV